MGRQRSLGLITVAAAGTPTQLSSTDVWCESYMIEPWFTNTGKVFIGSTSTDFRAGTTGMLGYTPIPHANVVGVFSSGKGSNGSSSFNLKDIYLDVENGHNGEGAIISYTG